MSASRLQKMVLRSEGPSKTLQGQQVLLPSTQIPHDCLHCECEGIITVMTLATLIPSDQVMRRIQAVLENVPHFMDVLQLCKSGTLVEAVKHDVNSIDCGILLQEVLHGNGMSGSSALKLLEWRSCRDFMSIAYGTGCTYNDKSMPKSDLTPQLLADA